MLSGLALAALAALTKAAEQLLHRFVVKAQDPLSYAFAWNGLMALLYLPLAASDASWPREPISWALVLGASCLWAAAAYTGFNAYSLLEVSYASPLTKLRVLLVLILSVVFLGEHLPPTKLAGTALLLLGALLIANPMRTRRQKSESRGVLHALATAALASGALVIDKRATQYFTPGAYSFLVFFLPSVMLVPLVRKRRDMVWRVIASSAKPLLAAATLSATSYYLTLAAFRVEEASVVVPIAETHVLFTVILGMVLLGEREDVGRKLGASLAIVAGAVLISGKLPVF